MPEEIQEVLPEEPVAPVPDYTEQLQLVSADVAIIKQILEGQKEITPFDYTEQLVNIESLLKKIQEEKPVSNPSDAVQYEQLVKRLDDVNTHLLNLENFSIPLLAGVGLLCGLVCAIIFSRFFRH